MLIQLKSQIDVTAIPLPVEYNSRIENIYHSGRHSVLTQYKRGSHITIFDWSVPIPNGRLYYIHKIQTGCICEHLASLVPSILYKIWSMTYIFSIQSRSRVSNFFSVRLRPCKPARSFGVNPSIDFCTAARKPNPRDCPV